MKKKTPQSVWIAAAVAALVLVAVLGYFVAISPQRGKASDLTAEIADVQRQIDDAHALVAKAKNAQKVKVADLFKLTKAMPDNPDEAGVLLDLNHVAQVSGITFDSINVDASVTLATYQVIPLRLQFDGNFYALTDFLFRLRNLVDVRRGALAATGRLFAVDNIALDEGEVHFPHIRAEIKIDAFVYGTGSPSDVAPAQSSVTPPPTSSNATTAPTTTTSTTTTSTTPTTPTTPAAPTGNATAAGGTP